MTCEERRDDLFLLAAEELDGSRARRAARAPRRRLPPLPRRSGRGPGIDRAASRVELEPVTPPETCAARSPRGSRSRRACRAPGAAAPAPAPARRGWRRLALAAGLAAVVAAGATALATRERVAARRAVARSAPRALDVIGSRYMRASSSRAPASASRAMAHLYWDYHRAAATCAPPRCARPSRARSTCSGSPTPTARRCAPACSR